MVHEGLKFNVDLLNRLVPKPEVMSDPIAGPFFQSSAPNVIIDTVKKAEDTKEIVVRLYEAYGGRGSFRLASSLPGIRTVKEVNLLEEEIVKEYSWNNGVNLEIKPFQIMTLKITL